MIGRVGRLGRSGQLFGPGEPAVLRFTAGLPGQVTYARTGAAVAFDGGAVLGSSPPERRRSRTGAS